MSSVQTQPPPGTGPAQPGAGAPPPADSKESIRTRAIRGSVWTAIGFAGSQGLRFGANLALTRLLFPEAFGTMALINSLITGLHLFSDVGVVPSIVQNKRGDDPTFLDTAWTIQIVRGVCLCLAACALAYPVANFYDDVSLAMFIPVAAASTIIDGLVSTKFHTLQRHIALGRRVLIEVGTQLVASVVMITWAWHSPSIWALIGGTLIGETFRTLVSHRLPGHRNRLCWDPAIARELFHFGKWIFLATVLTFAADQSDRLIFGKMIPLDQLGVYNIAFMLALMAPNVIEKIGDAVFFPSLSRMLHTGADVGPTFRNARAVLSALGAYAVAGMIVAGPPLMAILYDTRYADAGWMLQFLALGAWFHILESPVDALLLALGKVRIRTLTQVAKVVGLATLIPAGFAAYGFPGAMFGLSLAQLVKYVAACAVARRSGIQVLSCDLLPTAWLAAAVGISLFATSSLAGLGVGNLEIMLAAVAVVTTMWLPWGLSLWRKHRTR